MLSDTGHPGRKTRLTRSRRCTRAGFTWFENARLGQGGARALKKFVRVAGAITGVQGGSAAGAYSLAIEAAKAQT